MIRRSHAGHVPEELAVGFVDRHVVDAGVAPPHQPVVVELPVLVAVRAEPLPVGVVELVREPDRDPIPVVRPQFLDQTVFQFAVPLPGEEVDDLAAPLQKGGPIAPPTVLGVSLRDLLGITGIPAVLGGADLRDRGVECERGYGWATGHGERSSGRCCTYRYRPYQLVQSTV